MRFRILPVVILVSLFVMLAKLIDVMQDSSNLLANFNLKSITFASASSEQQAAKPENKPEEKPKKKASTDPKRYTVSDKPPENSLKLDPDNKCTQADYEMFDRLKKRREEIELREKTLIDKLNIIAVSEQRITDKINELKDLRDQIKGLISEYKNDQDQKVESLVKIYSSMKPKEASRIFEELDMDTLLLVVARMKEAKSAPIIAQMNPAKAKDLTIELANQSKFSKDICGCNASLN